MAVSPDLCDPLLRPFLAAGDEETARELLGELLVREASPLLWKVLRGQFRGAERPAEELEDLHAAALLRLARQLGDLRRGAAEPVASLGGYVAATGFNACRAHLRRLAPQRARLQDRLRYLLTHDPALALWQDASLAWLCGTARLRPRGDPTGGPARVPVAAEALGEALEAVPVAGAPSLVPLVRGGLARLAAPCRLADLVDLLARQLGVEDGEIGLEEGDPAGARLADPVRETVARLADREYLARLWREIVLLPLAQRRALLLNLRDARGGDMLSLLPQAGVASAGEVAGVLDVSPAELAALWPRLPCDDLAIAERLGLTRRQVINLRKSARARLERRMRGR
ncbi:MAG TPA: hypothetical protein VLA75_07825 [Thermoanaerobaculia bacterium]|nr:hypothetical protein [Thermoanaerobaculia bacterium]